MKSLKTQVMIPGTSIIAHKSLQLLLRWANIMINKDVAIDSKMYI